ncbi:HAD-IC family P-type ATPase [bacterium]|nr:HAD-IC family P-type ATPase [bacterium]
MNTVQKPWTTNWESIVSRLDSSVESGLTQQESRHRFDRLGPNQLEKRKKKSAWEILWNQFKNFVFLLLACASLISFAFQQWLEGIAILFALVINAVIGFFTEHKAVRSMEALYQISRTQTTVLRDGNPRKIAAENLVPGDIVYLNSGDIIAADMRVIESARLQVDESILTGESLPVTKVEESLDEETALADRKNMLYKGTSITGGVGQGIVVATGMQTRLGQISSMTEEAEEERAPLQNRLDRLAYNLIWLTLVVAAIVGIIGYIVGKELFLIIETSIALAIAAVPEGLPIVATVGLAHGVWRMAQRNAIINDLSAVETLGATNVICTDKTGTLTENRMTVTQVALASDTANRIDDIEAKSEEEHSVQLYLNDQELDLDAYTALPALIEVGILCNNAHLPTSQTKENEAEAEDKNPIGDPMEIALLRHGRNMGYERKDLVNSMPEKREESFNSDTKKMATFHQKDSEVRIAVKGAPEAVLSVCSSIQTKEGIQALDEETRQQWVGHNNELAQQGLRLLGMAEKTVDSLDREPYEGLTFLGLVGLFDPPRLKVKDAIEEIQSSGIQVVMVTGDHPKTAINICRQIGLTSDHDTTVYKGEEIESSDSQNPEQRQQLMRARVFSRVTPEQKLKLVELYQDNHKVVGMTGDGVNDAPALKKADIGIAMGGRGTQVAREASKMILKDDAFETIVVAIEYGRVIFNNIRKFIVFLLSGNLAEILIVACALLAGATLPLLPLQILYINMIFNVFPALAMVMGRGDESVMRQPPRDPSEPFLSKRHWGEIVGYAVILALAVLGNFAVGLTWMEMEPERAVTLSFITLMFARLWHVFNMRDWGSKFIDNDVMKNPYVWGATALCLGLILIAVFIPPLAHVLSVKFPQGIDWLMIVGASLIPLIVVQIVKSIKFPGFNK